MAMYTSPKRPLNDSLMRPRLRSKATLSGLNRLLDSRLRGNDGLNGSVGPRENDDLSSLALAGALGLHVGAVRQREVHDSPLVRGHRFQRHRSAGTGDAARDLPGHGLQRGDAALLVPRNVQHYPRPLAEAPAHHEVDQELHGPECLAAAADQQAGIVAVDVEHRAAHLLGVGLSEVHNYIDAHFRDEAVEYLSCGRHNVRGLFEEGDSDPRGLAPEAEESGLTSTFYVYFYLRAIGV